MDKAFHQKNHYKKVQYFVRVFESRKILYLRELWKLCMEDFEMKRVIKEE